LVASLATQNQQLQEQVKILAERLTKAETAYAGATEHDEIMNFLFRDKKFRRDVREAIRRLPKAK